MRAIIRIVVHDEDRSADVSILIRTRADEQLYLWKSTTLNNLSLHSRPGFVNLTPPVSNLDSRETSSNKRYSPFYNFDGGGHAEMMDVTVM
jgi:cytidylate kinase